MPQTITISKQKVYQLKLTVATKSQLPDPLIAQINYQTTLIATKKTYFYYLTTKDLLTRAQLFAYFSQIPTKLGCSHDLDIDVAAFSNEQITESQALQTIYEALLFGSAQLYSLKLDQPTNPEIKFNLITDVELPEYTSEDQIITQGYYINVTRELQDMPPNILYPEVFADRIVKEAQDIKNLKVTILNKKAIQDLGMGLLLAVNAGSHHEPRVVVLEYTGDASNQKDILGLVGKGITFDTGGYNLKPRQFMKDMKFDMSGAAIACNSVLTAAQLGLKINLVAIACLTENVIGGHATLVETVATSMNGLTVEINDTDAEGRLVLADGITYALRNGKATKIIELSTLTGSIVVALADYMSGAFSNNDALFNTFHMASQQTNEEIWRMPIHARNTEKMKTSAIADLTNVAKDNYSDAGNAAAFLQEFVENKPFLHLDIAGTAYTKGGRGQAVLLKTLVQYMKNISN